jgi:hypothetical protein
MCATLFLKWLFNPGGNPIAIGLVSEKFILSTAFGVGQKSEAFHEAASYCIEKGAQKSHATT